MCASFLFPFGCLCYASGTCWGSQAQAHTNGAAPHFSSLLLLLQLEIISASAPCVFFFAYQCNVCLRLVDLCLLFIPFVSVFACPYSNMSRDARRKQRTRVGQHGYKAEYSTALSSHRTVFVTWECAFAFRFLADLVRGARHGQEWSRGGAARVGRKARPDRGRYAQAAGPQVIGRVRVHSCGLG